MVDNVSISEGDGDKTIATDDVGGVQYQRIKISWGGDGNATEVDTASGKPFPVQLRGSAGGDVVKLEDDASANADPGVPMLAVRKAAPANTSGADGDYEFLQMSSGRLWVDPSGVTLNLIAGQTGVAGGAGVSGASTQRVIHATDDPLVAAVKGEDDASANGDKGVVIFAKRADAPAATSNADGDYEALQVFQGMQWTWSMGLGVTCDTDIARPPDTTAYVANDAWANSTSAPTSGGFTVGATNSKNAARKSGGSGIITDAVITSSNPAGTPLQGEIWLFDQAVTAINDNAAFSLSDSDAKNFVGKVPFTLAVDATNNSQAHVTGLNIFFTCIGSANLRFLVKVKNAYTPASAEVLTVRLKIVYLD
jgi:hypothetical protein